MLNRPFSAAHIKRFALVTVALMAVFALVPQIDLFVSHLFFDKASGQFPLRNTGIMAAISAVSNMLVVVFIISCFFARFLAHRRVSFFQFMTRPLFLFFTITFIVGPIFVVNFGLKDNWGRARPVDVVEFGGTKQFTPYYQPADQCASDCSFTSGHTARASYFMSLVVAVFAAGWSSRHRRAVLVFALTFAAAAAFGRLAEGKHYLSDVIGSFVLMSWLSLLLYDVIMRGGQDVQQEDERP